MYVYFDENGILKEIISDKSFRVGDSKRDKIYVYWAGEHAPVSGWVKYRKPNGQEYPDLIEECFYQLGDQLVGKALPNKPLRNLKYFSYDHTYEENGETHIGYKFYEITVPDAILNSSMDNEEVPTENNMVVARIRFVLDNDANGVVSKYDTIEAMGALVFAVETNIGILTDSSINESQYNYLVSLISMKVGYGTKSLKVSELPPTGVAGTIYYVDTNSGTIYDAYFWNGTSFVFLGTTSYGLYTKKDGDEFEAAMQALFDDLTNDVQSDLERYASLIEAAASGSPKGTFATLSELQSAYPTGTTGIYVIQSNGHWYYWNGSAWTDGGAYLTAEYAPNSVREIIRDGYITDRKNLYSYKDCILNAYWGYDETNNIISPVSNTNWVCFICELIGDDLKYMIKYKDYSVFALDKDKKVIGDAHINYGEKAYNVPSGTRYLAISIYKNHAPDFWLVAGEIAPTGKPVYGTALSRGCPEIYCVGQRNYTEENTPQYTNFIQLLKDLKDNDNEKIIYIYPGIYDLFEEYGGADYFATLDGTEAWASVNAFVPPNTKIIGLGNVVLKFMPTQEQIGSEAVAHLFSALNLHGDCYIENITIECQNNRYCVHDDIVSTELYTRFLNARHIFKNVKMIKYNSYGDGQCYGAGVGISCYYEFDGCTFIAVNNAFSTHSNDSNHNKESSMYVFKNCYFESSVAGASISLRNNSSIECHHIVNIYNSYVGGQWANLQITNLGNSSAKQNFDVTLLGCNAIRGEVITTIENPYPIKQYNSIGTV